MDNSTSLDLKAQRRKKVKVNGEMGESRWKWEGVRDIYSEVCLLPLSDAVFNAISIEVFSETRGLSMFFQSFCMIMIGGSAFDECILLKSYAYWKSVSKLNSKL